MVHHGQLGAGNWCFLEPGCIGSRHGKACQVTKMNSNAVKKRPASHPERAFGFKAFHTSLYLRAIVVCGEPSRSKQDIGDLWRLTHRHGVLRRTALGYVLVSNSIAIRA
jgi:hypothetical protein